MHCLVKKLFSRVDSYFILGFWLPRFYFSLFKIYDVSINNVESETEKCGSFQMHKFPNPTFMCNKRHFFGTVIFV